MKKLSIGTLLLFLLAVCAFNLSSCQEFNIDSQSEFPPTLETDALAEYSVAATAPRTIMFNISSTTPWKIKSDKEWCTPTPAMSSASALIAEVTVNILEYTDETSERTATLTITAEGVEESRAITITQFAKGALYVTNFENNFPSTGGADNAATFTVNSNKPWKIVKTEQWIELDKESGEGSAETVTVTATVHPNTGVRRNATLTIISDGVEKEVIATQDGMIFEFGEIADDDLIFSSNAGESKTYPIATSLTADQWDVTTEDTWIELTKNTENKTVTVKTLSEIYFKDRTATIKLEATDKNLGLEPVVLTVKQNRGEIIWDNGAQYTLGEESGVTITKNRFYPNKIYKRAIFEAKIKSIAFDNDSYGLHLSYYKSVESAQGPTLHCWLGEFDGNINAVAPNDYCFRYRDNWGDNTVANTGEKIPDLTREGVIAMKTLRLSIIPDRDAKDNVIVELDIDGVQKNTKKGWKNPFIGNGSGYPGNRIYFGFIKDAKGGTLELESFEVTPIDTPTE